MRDFIYGSCCALGVWALAGLAGKAGRAGPERGAGPGRRLEDLERELAALRRETAALREELARLREVPRPDPEAAVSAAVQEGIENLMRYAAGRVPGVEAEVR